jgi:hypothetical protein
MLANNSRQGEVCPSARVVKMKGGGFSMQSDRPLDKNAEVQDAQNENAITGNISDAEIGTTAKPVSRLSSDDEERRKIRRLQLMMDMVMSVIGQDESLTVDEAAEMVADSKKAALAMFPDKELAYNLIYKPRLQRLMRERFRIQ